MDVPAHKAAESEEIEKKIKAFFAKKKRVTQAKLGDVKPLIPHNGNISDRARKTLAYKI